MMTTSTATKARTESPQADRAEVNRRNAQKSTGPRSAEGKERSRFNAVKHGMTAKTLVLPGEDPEALQHRLDGWVGSLKPRNELEEYLVERAVRVSWQLDRADRAEVARLTGLMRDDAFQDSHSQANVDVVALGRRLFWDRRGPLELYPHFPLKDQLLASKKPRTSFSGLAEDPDDPTGLLIQLEGSEAGCLWLLQQWAELREILDQDLLWQSIDRFKATRLLGRQPTDAADYSDVTTIYLASWMMHPQSSEIDPFQDVYNELLAGEAILFRQRLDGRVVQDYLPADKDDAKAKLLAIVTAAVDRLTIVSKVHEDRAEAVAADRSARLAFDDSEEGERLRRYQIACGRSLNRSLDMLLKIRKAEVRQRPVPVDGTPDVPDVSERVVATELRGTIQDEPEPGFGDELPTPPVDRPEPEAEPRTSDDQDSRNEPTSARVERMPGTSPAVQEHGNTRNEPRIRKESRPSREQVSDGSERSVDHGRSIDRTDPGLQRHETCILQPRAEATPAPSLPPEKGSPNRRGHGATRSVEQRALSEPSG